MSNIFKKKNNSNKLISQKPRTVLCIPGNWNDRSEIVKAIAKNNLNEFVFAGMILLNMKSNVGFKLEICERDSRMKDAFKWAGMVNQISEEFLKMVDQHKYVIYISGETGNTESAKSILKQEMPF
jgi:hypothetical protein